ncbi:MAG: hypothetical protein JST75_09550 [Bacteroidetes bacterium]|nr:hypothetical protein [Bacteroidota bacterium]
MDTTFLYIKEAMDFLENNPNVEKALKNLVHSLIDLKRVSFKSTEFSTEHSLLRDSSLIIPGQLDQFHLNFDNLVVCKVLGDVASSIMNEQIPKEPIEALSFANRFALEIRKPKTNYYWYNSLELKFESYIVIFLHQILNLDFIAFYNSLTDEKKAEDPNLKSLDLCMSNVIPYLNNDNSKIYSFLQKLLQDDGARDAVQHSLVEFGRKNSKKAASFYVYCKDNGAIAQTGFLVHLLLGLYETNPDFYFEEAINLFDQNPKEAICTIAWLEYTKAEHISRAFTFVEDKKLSDINQLRHLPAFYCRLIQNKNTPQEILNACFKAIQKLTLQEDQQLRSDLVFRTGLIKGFDKEKYELLPSFLSWGEPGVIRSYFDHFNSPDYLFELIQNSYLTHGLATNIKLVEDAVFVQHSKNPGAVEAHILAMLSDDRPIIRFGGLQVLICKGCGVYPVAFLSLDEKQQLTVVNFLLTLPINIEELLPLCLVLRNSPFEKVQQDLTQQLNDLVWAYDEHVLLMMKPLLDLSVATDKKLYDEVEASYLKYAAEKELRMGIREFDPWENELPYVELFFRLEHEMDAEAMEKASSKSVFTQIAKSISVIRGSAFNSEHNHQISPLNTVGVSRLVDQRYSINPDKVEWEFKMSTSVNH